LTILINTTTLIGTSFIQIDKDSTNY